MGDNWRVIKVSLFHAIFANFGDIEANIMNYMTVPVRKFFASSLDSHYQINATIASAEFELIYSTIASTFFFGVLFGGFVTGYMMDNYGRKGTAVYIRDILGIASPFCMIVAKYLNWIELFVLGQFLAGFLNAFKAVLFIYMSECTPDDKRGFTTMAIGAGGNLLLLFVAPFCLPQAFGTDRDWWLLPAFCLLLALIHLIVAGHFPESPKHLFIEQRLCISARHAVKYYHGDSANVESVIEEYKRERNLIHHRHVTFLDIIKSRRLRWCLAVVLINAFVPATSLINLKSQYLESMLMNFNLDQSTAMMSTMMMTAFTAPLCLLAPFLVERLGRRPVFLIVSALAAFELAFVALAQTGVDLRIRWDMHGIVADALGALAPMIGLGGFSLGSASAMLGLLNMNAVLLSEMCPHAARAIFSKISQVVPMSVVLILVICYPIITAKYGVLFLVPLFAVNLGLLIASFLYLPETKGLPVDTIFKNLLGADKRSSAVGSNTSLRSLRRNDSINAEDSSEWDDENSVANYGSLKSESSQSTIENV